MGPGERFSDGMSGSRREPARDPGSFIGPGLPADDVAPVLELLQASFGRPGDPGRAIAVYERLAAEGLLAPASARRTHRGARIRTVLLAAAMTLLVAGGALAAGRVIGNDEGATRGPERRDGAFGTTQEHDEAVDTLGATGAAGSSGAAGPPAREGQGSDRRAAGGGDEPAGGAAACDTAAGPTDARRAGARAEYEREVDDARADRDEALADLDAERAEVTADLNAERAGVLADANAELRELRREWEQAEDEEERREIEREIAAVERERDLALAEIERERAEALADLDAERADVFGDYAAAVADARAELDEAMADLDGEAVGGCPGA